MDKYRMEVERLKERGEIVKKHRGAKTTLKERIFRIGWPIAKYSAVIAITALLILSWTEIPNKHFWVVQIFGGLLVIAVIIVFVIGRTNGHDMDDIVDSPEWRHLGCNAFHNRDDD